MATTARRFDDKLGAPLLRVFVRPEDGARLCEGIATQEGVLVYRNADGTERLELVTRQAVLDTAATIGRATMTLHHPEDGFVGPDNYQRHAIGDVDGDVRVEEFGAQGGFARVRVLTAVRRADALDALAAGVCQLSSGYEVDLDETPGVHPVFGRYDACQVGRRINHLALVPEGRSGPEVALRTDSADAVCARRIDHHESGATRMDSTMKHLLVALGLLGITLRADAKDDDQGAALVEGIKKLKADMAEMGEKLAAAENGGDALKAFLDAYQLKDLAALKAKFAEMGAQLTAAQQEAAAAKAALQAKEDEAAAAAQQAEIGRMDALAKQLGLKTDGLDLKAKRLAIAKTRVDSIDAKASDTYIAAVLDIIEGDLKARGQRADAAGATGARLDDWADKRGDRREDAKDEFYNPHVAHSDAAFRGDK
jgi:hypothetical protein